MKSARVYILITIVITSYLLQACSKSASVENSAPPLDSAVLVAVLTDCNADFKQREDLLKLRDAIDRLASVRDPDNRNFDVESSLAKFNYFLGIGTDDEKEAADAFNKGREAGKIASKLETSKPDGYFWFGANLGELARKSPITVGLRSVDDIKEAMNKVIEIQPDFQGGSAYDVLAQVELATRINGGKAEKAVQYLEQGIAIEDDNSNLHLHLAEAYLAVNRDKDARVQLEHVINMSPNPDYLPEHRTAVRAAKKLLVTKF
jgi:tetratricopeptide (TPR) repeat protein